MTGPLRWVRSAGSKNLFLVQGNGRMRTRVACVYRRQEDGLFGWKARGVPFDETGLPTEDICIERLYQALGM
jgi:hypothetical protein